VAEVTGTRHRGPLPPGVAGVDLDLLEPASIEAALEQARPDAVVHSAALAEATVCEQQPELAMRSNVAASEALARACRGRGIRLVTLSTDLVFSGERSGWAEDDPALPLSVYGRTKLQAEQATLAECPGSAVARVALVQGRGHGPRATSSEAAAWSLASGARLRLFGDQYRTPVDAESVADGLLRILDGGHAGRFHLGGPERVSRLEQGRRVAALLGLPKAGIEPIRQADLPLPGARPADASLDSSRARRVLGWEPRPLEIGIREGRRRPD
jgi:dTDP-4-dehydrorhamnose reductase